MAISNESIVINNCQPFYRNSKEKCNRTSLENARGHDSPKNDSQFVKSVFINESVHHAPTLYCNLQDNNCHPKSLRLNNTKYIGDSPRSPAPLNNRKRLYSCTDIDAEFLCSEKKHHAHDIDAVSTLLDFNPVSVSVSPTHFGDHASDHDTASIIEDDFIPIDTFIDLEVRETMNSIIESICKDEDDENTEEMCPSEFSFADSSYLDDASAWVTDRDLDSEADDEDENYPSDVDEVKSCVSPNIGTGMDLEHFAQGLAMNMFRNVVILSGAGVSCAAGIPDFRTPGTGLYDNLQRYNLPEPEDVFDLDFYRNNPRPFVSLVQELWPGQNKHKPTITHSFIKLMDKKGILRRNFTQNIDGLEVLAGVSEDKVYECHGNFRTASCVDCKSDFGGERCKRAMLAGIIPTCDHCGGPVKPDIVFFGEPLAPQFSDLVRQDLPQADLLIVIGTSLKIPPVCLIPELVKCPRLLLNKECVGTFGPGSASPGPLDLFFECECDAGVRKLCQMAGWETELDSIHATQA